MRTILFVCTGNTCRSPMAEAIARRWIQRGEAGPPESYLVVSSGVAATEGAPPTREAVEALRGREIDVDGRSKRLSARMIRKADLVFCMTAGHRDAARGLVIGEPEHEEKIVPLDPAGDVEDPLGQGQAAYDRLAQRLMELIPKRLKEVLKT